MNLEVKTLISSPIPTSNNIDIQKTCSIEFTIESTKELTIESTIVLTIELSINDH